MLFEICNNSEQFYRVEATDGDFASEFNTVTYWIDSAADHFGIDSATGDLYLTKKLDCENQTIHTLQVCTVKLLKIRISEKFTVIILKFDYRFILSPRYLVPGDKIKSCPRGQDTTWYLVPGDTLPRGRMSPPGLSCPRGQDTVGTVSCPQGHFTPG